VIVDGRRTRSGAARGLRRVDPAAADLAAVQGAMSRPAHVGIVGDAITEVLG